MNVAAEREPFFVRAEIGFDRERSWTYRMRAVIHGSFLSLAVHAGDEGWQPSDAGPHILLLFPEALAIDAIRRGGGRYDFSGPRLGEMTLLSGYPGYDVGFGGHNVIAAEIDVSKTADGFLVRVTSTLKPIEENFGRDNRYASMRASFAIGDSELPDIFLSWGGWSRNDFAMMLSGAGVSPSRF